MSPKQATNFTWSFLEYFIPYVLVCRIEVLSAPHSVIHIRPNLKYLFPVNSINFNMFQPG